MVNSLSELLNIFCMFFYNAISVLSLVFAQRIVIVLLKRFNYIAKHLRFPVLVL